MSVWSLVRRHRRGDGGRPRPRPAAPRPRRRGGDRRVDRDDRGAQAGRAAASRDLDPAAPPWHLANVFPSGHTTIGMATAVAFVLVVPYRCARARRRSPAPIYAAALAASTLEAGWHRTSDALGGDLPRGGLALVGVRRPRGLAGRRPPTATAPHVGVRPAGGRGGASARWCVVVGGPRTVRAIDRGPLDGVGRPRGVRGDGDPGGPRRWWWSWSSCSSPCATCRSTCRPRSLADIADARPRTSDRDEPVSRPMASAARSVRFVTRTNVTKRSTRCAEPHSSPVPAGASDGPSPPPSPPTAGTSSSTPATPPPSTPPEPRSTPPGPGDVVALTGDIDDPIHVAGLVGAAVDQGRFDLLVNNAGTLGPEPAPAAVPPAARRPRTHPAHQRGGAAAAHPGRTPPPPRAGGAIVNVTSDAAVEGYEGWGGYGASKAALEQLSRVLAVEEPAVARLLGRPGRHAHADAPGRLPRRGHLRPPVARVPGARTAAPSCRERPASGRYRVDDLLTRGGPSRASRAGGREPRRRRLPPRGSARHATVADEGHRHARPGGRRDRSRSRPEAPARPAARTAARTTARPFRIPAGGEAGTPIELVAGDGVVGSDARADVRLLVARRATGELTHARFADLRRRPRRRRRARGQHVRRHPGRRRGDGTGRPRAAAAPVHRAAGRLLGGRAPPPGRRRHDPRTRAIRPGALVLAGGGRATLLARTPPVPRTPPAVAGPARPADRHPAVPRRPRPADPLRPHRGCLAARPPTSRCSRGCPGSAEMPSAARPVHRCAGHRPRAPAASWSPR